MSTASKIEIIPNKIKIILNNTKEEKKEYQNIKISNSDKSEFDILVEYVKNFIDEKIIVTSNRENRLNAKDLYNEFNLWYINKEQIEKSTYSFGKAMKRNGMISIRNGKGTFYLGIKFKN